MGELPRAFVKIQKLRRIAIPDHLMKRLNWSIGTQIILEAHKGKLIVSPMDSSLKPKEERYR